MHLSALNLAARLRNPMSDVPSSRRAIRTASCFPKCFSAEVRTTCFSLPLRPSRNERERLSGEASRAYRTVIERFPEFPGVDLARVQLGSNPLPQSEYEKAQDILEKIPPPDRTGELALVSMLLADCLIGQTPTKADDALAAGKVQEQLNTAIQLLAIASNQPDHALVPDALSSSGSLSATPSGYPFFRRGAEEYAESRPDYLRQDL